MLLVTEDNYELLKKINTELHLTNPRVKFVLRFYHITPGMYGRKDRNSSKDKQSNPLINTAAYL